MSLSFLAVSAREESLNVVQFVVFLKVKHRNNSGEAEAILMLRPMSIFPLQAILTRSTKNQVGSI